MYDGLAQALQRQTGEPKLGLLDLGDLVDVLEAHCSRDLLPRIACAEPLPPLPHGRLGRVAQKPGRVRCADVEVECPVWSDRDHDGQRRTDVILGCARIKLLTAVSG